jgi:bifunctional non-homologous end joining protein LigD
LPLAPPPYRPMAATLVAAPFDHPDWVFEPKRDGLGVLGRFDGRGLTLLGRNDRPHGAPFPEGLVNNLTPAQLADLIAHLQTLK